MPDFLIFSPEAARTRALAVDWRSAVLPIAVFLAVSIYAADNGGYYPTSWN